MPNLKRFILTAFAWLCLAAPALADKLSEAAGQYRIDGSSHIAFTVSQVGGGGISGDFGKFSGSFKLDAGDIGRSSVKFTLMPESVRTGDARVERFLRSDAIFDVANSPSITFRSTAVRRTGDNSARIDGVLTARGISKNETFTAEVTSLTKHAIAFHVTGKILRSPYGMDSGTPIYSNVVEFNMDLRASR